MKRLNRKSKMIISIILIAIIAVSYMLTFIIQAENVVILEETDCDLTLEAIHGKSELTSGIWDTIDGDLKQKDDIYTLSSNGFAQWYDKDSLHFAYKKVIFNYGKVATLTAETQLNSWNAVSTEGGAGLMIRSGLGPEAATVMLHTRKECIFFTYRTADGTMSYRGGKLDLPPNYPVNFKIVLNKNKVECYYKQKTDKEYVKLGVAQFIYGPSVYIGLSAYSQTESDIAKSVFEGFHYQIEAPEGTEVSTDETASGPADAEEEEIVLPEDFPVSENTLLTETFTDGSIFDGEESVTNPIWRTNNLAVEIFANEEKNNRFLNEYMTDVYYFAGDEHWTDYETSLDITFTDEFGLDEANTVDVLTRFTSIDQYGYHYYVLRFTSLNQIQLGYVQGAQTPKASNSIKVVDTYEYNYVDTENVERTAKDLHIRIRTFDNKISVWLNDGKEEKQIFSFADTSGSVKAQGKIGFAVYNAAVKFDNIKVIKLDDLLGGDYDNKIAGLWDEETPRYIKEYIDSGYIY